MTLTRLLITAVVIEKRPVRDVAVQYGVSVSWLYELLSRYRVEGEAVFEPRSRRPKSNPNAIAAEVSDLIVELRHKLTASGLDAGPDTIRWHLEHHHATTVSRATVARHLSRAGLVVPEPKKKPKSSYIRFAADQPNQCWQSDLTHYRLTRSDGRPGPDTEASRVSCTPWLRVNDRLAVTDFCIIVGLVLGGWFPAEAVHESAGVVPRHPLCGDLFDVAESVQRAGPER